MFSKIPWSILLRYGLPTLFAAFIAFKIITYWIGVGESNVQIEWERERQAYAAEVQRLKDVITARERQHRTETDAINTRLADAEASYAADIANVRGQYAISLRRSDDRAAIYERLSDSGATERANLASYAAQLDRSLVEGRQVVGELRSTLVQRDRQLIQLGEQLQADRRLINEAPTLAQ